MSDSFIGHARCSRCGGGDSNCPVCHTEDTPAEHTEKKEKRKPREWKLRRPPVPLDLRPKLHD